MRTRKIVQSAAIMILALVFVVGMATVVRADGPWPWSQILPWPATTPWPTAHPLGVGERFSFGFAAFPATPAPPAINVGGQFWPAGPVAPPPSNSALPVAPVPPAPAAPSGDSPSNALGADGATRTLAPGASVWYKIGNGGDHMEVYLEANPLSNVSLQVFAPGNLSDPVGQGTLQKSSGRLLWAGGHWDSEGAWLARITNSNPIAAQYTLTSSARAIGKKTCTGYWEYLPTGQYIYWRECQ